MLKKYNELDPASFAKIQRRSEDFLLAEETYPYLKQIAAQREALEIKILNLQSKMVTYKYSTGEHHLKSLNQLQADLKVHHQQIRKIDHELDQWDELNEESLQKIRRALFLEIWNSFPQHFIEQETIWYQLEQKISFNRQFTPIQSFLEELLHVLKSVRETRIKMQGKGILSYIFGTSPNAIIEKYLLFAHDLILNHLQLIKELKQNAISKPIHLQLEEIYQVVEQLKDDCKKTWGFRHIDQTIATHEDQLSVLNSQIIEYAKKIQNEISYLNKELDNWLKELVEYEASSKE